MTRPVRVRVRQSTEDDRSKAFSTVIYKGNLGPGTLQNEVSGGFGEGEGGVMRAGRGSTWLLRDASRRC